MWPYNPHEVDHPQWFIDGIDALLYVPTAINRQAFAVEGERNRVSMRYKGGFYAGIDLGIGKYHSESANIILK